MYALGMQGRYGDIKDPEPSLLDIKGHLVWDAWNKRKGTDMMKARQQFVDLALAIIERNHLGDWHLPEYWKNKTLHDECMKEKLKNASEDEKRRIIE